MKIMAKLAIKGHEKRGAEVIALLEMLGGKNTLELEGIFCNSYYISDDDGEIVVDLVDRCNREQYSLYSLEEFEEKFPYKVGDEVIIKKKNQIATVEKITWCFDTITYWLKYGGCIEGNWRTEHLQFCKKEIMKDNIIDAVKENANRYRIVLNPQFDMEVDEGEYYAVRRKPQYPKTYEECCKVLVYEPNRQSVTGYHAELIEKFQKLLMCRDAYWNIGGKQMGLGEPWKPDFTDTSQRKCCIYNNRGDIRMDVLYFANIILAFPTKEMRDEFHKNFKELIEECKELL